MFNTKFMIKRYTIWAYLLMIHFVLSGQSVSDFRSLESAFPTAAFEIPYTHTFQIMARHGDSLTSGGYFPDNFDFTGYVPIDGSSEKGYLSISSELWVGGASVLSMEWDSVRKGWETSHSQAVDFSVVGGGSRHCSGTVTPWNTVIVCEEAIQQDLNGDGYFDFGWVTEFDPSTCKVINHPGGLPEADKLWALGNMAHENVVIHPNRRTVYQGADMAVGYLYKFVADSAGDLSSGSLYVYKGAKTDSGEWVLIPNTTPQECNSTLYYSDSVGATVFSGIEDVEINPFDGKIYVAVKNENSVYSFRDSDPISGTKVSEFQTYVGNRSYWIYTDSDSMEVPWGTGNDNLAFDEKGNLWVLQDGSLNFIWVVDSGHTQENPKVRIFGRSPVGSEPTGITFSPDFRFLFMSIQHPSPNNIASGQPDAWGNSISFDDDVAMVIARKEFLGNGGLPMIAGDSEVKTEERTINIQWSTLKEHDLKHFILYRSTDKMTWDSIETRQAKGNSNSKQTYESIDYYPKPGKNFYRIKVIQENGNYFHLDLGSAIFLSSPHLLWAYPNPGKGKITVFYPPAYNVKAVNLFTLSGENVGFESDIMEDKVEIKPSFTHEGMYIIQLIMENGEVLSIKYDARP